MLEVYRDPDPVSEKYREVKRYGEGETISPLQAPPSEIAIRDLLPRGK